MNRQAPRSGRPVAFLFLGETLLIPHLYPIAEEMAGRPDAPPVDLWVATRTHEVLLERWLREAGLTRVRIRRAPGWRWTADPETGSNPALPAKLPMLVRMLPALLRASAVVCAEQTSLWLPRVLGRERILPPFFNTLHGAGTINYGYDDARRHAPSLTLVATQADRASFLQHGVDPARVVTTGYVKSCFRHLGQGKPRFANDRSILLYNPHWQKERSSWWSWGRGVIDAIVDSGRYNLIFAPHQRLVERAPEVADLCNSLAGRDDVLCDYHSFAAVDGSYPAAADIYIGDTSSQVLEFLQSPRPALFLNPFGHDWQDDPTLSIWHCGQVVARLDDLLPAIAQAAAAQEPLRSFQKSFVEGRLGVLDGQAPRRAADAILDYIARPR